MNNLFQVFSEPKIEFRYNQKLYDPRDGLYLFGPYDADNPQCPKNIIYGVLGTKKGIQKFSEWTKLMSKLVLPKKDLDKKLWKPFPGFEVAYDTIFSNNPSWIYEINEDKLLKASKHKDPYKRTYDVVQKYLDGISIVKTKKDEVYNVLFCIVPEEVWKNCRPKSKIINGWGYFPSKKVRKQRFKGQVSILDDWVADKLDKIKEWEPEQYKLSIDFRRQIKAKSMKFDIPIQIIRESTFQFDLSIG